jgi:hypothetical protein
MALVEENNSNPQTFNRIIGNTTYTFVNGEQNLN